MTADSLLEIAVACVDGISTADGCEIKKHLFRESLIREDHITAGTRAGEQADDRLRPVVGDHEFTPDTGVFYFPGELEDLFVQIAVRHSDRFVTIVTAAVDQGRVKIVFPRFHQFPES